MRDIVATPGGENDRADNEKNARKGNGFCVHTRRHCIARANEWRFCIDLSSPDLDRRRGPPASRVVQEFLPFGAKQLTRRLP